MALGATERKRQQIERDRVERNSRPDPSYSELVFPFHEYIHENRNSPDFQMAFDFMDIMPPEFNDNSGPRATSLQDEIPPGFQNAIGRAEFMVICLLNAARALAETINDYKVDEITARLKEIEESDLSGIDDRKAAMAKVVQLNNMLAQLEKSVRWSAPTWRLSED